MAELVHGTQPEFWRPPMQTTTQDGLVPQSITTMAEACPRCATEFLLGSRFCHACGTKRPEGLSSATIADAAVMAGMWQQGVHRVGSFFKGIPWSKIKAPTWLRYLHFQEIKNRTGLSTGSLIAFVIGLACVAGALLVGLLTANTLVEWQAIQFYRAEWLLAATASFVAGILLKKPSAH
ncbi:MAG TPA: zinc ribbon domain-containing protein [Candidatus Sulfotelmatobacter sp.]|nr:zinc ribbon domain-containing protein [Candidatus Sulfotelmatobacter sp.]